LEKIIMITPDQEANRYLLPCLKLLFPECVIESLNGKMVHDSGIFREDDVRIFEIKEEFNSHLILTNR
jgi:hypothetical protein